MGRRPHPRLDGDDVQGRGQPRRGPCSGGWPSARSWGPSVDIGDQRRKGVQNEGPQRRAPSAEGSESQPAADHA
eukprot:4770372-Pyramimonas_sp.AAC.1